jgi:DNA polymerase-3 subunit alpha
VQYRTSKSGKDWATFSLEGYDENHEFRIFDEEYLKFRHFLVNNQFVFFKMLVREGWVNRETGKKSDPRIQFTDVKFLADVLPLFAKKLIIQMEIKELQQEAVQHLNDLFRKFKGDKSLLFEVLEIEKVQQQAVLPIQQETISNQQDTDDFTDAENVDLPVIEDVIVNDKVVTFLSLPSRTFRVDICKELLIELDKTQIQFKLN